MANPTISRTALGTAICRLIEQYQPKQTRLFDDPVAKALVGAPIHAMMQFSALRNYTVKQTDAVARGIFGVQICRTRYVDDALQAALAQGIRQVVTLGERLDTRPYRLPGMQAVRVFEFDLPAIQNNKKKKLKKFLGKIPENVTFVPIDFDTQLSEAAIAGTAFDPASQAVFIWEGVTQYIAEQAVQRTLAFIRKSAPGSLLVFTYVLKSLLERRSGIPDADHMLDTVAKTALWIFGLEPASLSAFLQPFHLNLVEDVGAADYQEKYLRPLGRTLDIFSGERIAQARVV